MVALPSNAQVYGLSDVACGKLVQLDVTKENCMPDGDGCVSANVIDYIVYYTGDCTKPIVTPTPTPTVTPSVTPTPSITPTVTPTPDAPTVACKSLTATAKDTSGAQYSINSLPENFNGQIELTCVGQATVKPIVSMEFTLQKL